MCMPQTIYLRYKDFPHVSYAYIVSIGVGWEALVFKIVSKHLITIYSGNTCLQITITQNAFSLHRRHVTHTTKVLCQTETHSTLLVVQPFCAHVHGAHGHVPQWDPQIIEVCIAVVHILIANRWLAVLCYHSLH